MNRIVHTLSNVCHTLCTVVFKIAGGVEGIHAVILRLVSRRAELAIENRSPFFLIEKRKKKGALRIPYPYM